MRPISPARPGCYRRTDRPISPDIPRLEDKEKEERKGAGALWIAESGEPGTAVLSGQGAARIGAAFARPGFLGAGRMAAALADFFGGPSTILGGLFSSWLGGPLVLTVLLGWCGLLAAAAFKLSGLGRVEQAEAAPVRLERGLASGIVIHGAEDRSLGYLAQANQGELLFDAGHDGKLRDAVSQPAPKAQPEAAPAPAAQDSQFQVKVPDIAKLAAGAAAKGLDREGFAWKMKNDTSLLLGQAALPASNGAFQLKKTFASSITPTSATTLGRTGAMRRSMTALTRGHKVSQTGSASRAMGQLKLARTMSDYGAKAAQESAARQYSTDAFEQGKTTGQSIDDSGIVVPASVDNAAGTTDSTDDSTDVPDTGTSSNATPYQSTVDSAENDSNSSAMYKIIGMILLAAGAVLCALGAKLMSNPFTAAMGAALLAAGIALIVLGGIMLAMSSSLAGAAESAGDSVKDDYGQTDQGDTIDDCATEANQNGTKTSECTSASSDEAKDKSGQNTVHDSTQEESKAGYTLSAS